MASRLRFLKAHAVTVGLRRWKSFRLDSGWFGMRWARAGTTISRFECLLTNAG